MAVLLLPEPFYYVCTLSSGPNVRRQDQDQSTKVEVGPELSLRIGVVIGEGLYSDQAQKVKL